MRIAVMGVGDVGSHYGGALVLAGEDVTFIVKSARLDSIRANGLMGQASQGPRRRLG